MSCEITRCWPVWIFKSTQASVGPSAEAFWYVGQPRNCSSLCGCSPYCCWRSRVLTSQDLQSVRTAAAWCWNTHTDAGTRIFSRHWILASVCSQVLWLYVIVSAWFHFSVFQILRVCVGSASSARHMYHQIVERSTRPGFIWCPCLIIYSPELAE